jgi:hypothetical protein
MPRTPFAPAASEARDVASTGNFDEFIEVDNNHPFDLALMQPSHLSDCRRSAKRRVVTRQFVQHYVVIMA